MSASEDQGRELHDVLGVSVIPGLDVVKRSETRLRRPIYPQHLSSAALTNRIRAGKAFSGTIRMHPNSCWKAIVLVRRDNADPLELKVAGSLNINRAVDGDKVVVQLLDPTDSIHISATMEEEAAMDERVDATPPAAAPTAQPSLNSTEPHGKIIGIIKRNWRTYCGSLRSRDASMRGQERQLVPTSPKIPVIVIKSSQSHLLERRRLVCAIDAWDRFSLHPRGHWIEDLGPVDDLATECTVILREHDVITR